MKQDLTDITIVLDRSGSMGSVEDETIGGFNRFLKDQRAAAGTANLTLNQFDHEFLTPIKAQDVKAAPELTKETFVPRGSTALLDAIGRSIVETGNRMQAIPEDQRPAKVIMVIITDGFENASKEYTQAKVHEMIDHQRSTYKWEFVFLGANQDAIKTAGNYGIKAASSMTYASNSEGTKAAFGSLSASLCAVRSGASMCADFNDADRKAQHLAGAQH